MNRLFTAFIVGAMVLGVGVGWLVNQALPAADAKTVADNLSTTRMTCAVSRSASAATSSSATFAAPPTHTSTGCDV